MNTHRITGLASTFALGVAGLWLATATPANAAIYYPWCAQYSGSETGGGSNCYFSTKQQCMVTVSGVGGMCEPNPFYDAARPEERAGAVVKVPSKRRHAY